MQKQIFYAREQTRLTSASANQERKLNNFYYLPIDISFKRQFGVVKFIQNVFD